MIIFNDALTGDELISDAYDCQKIADGAVFSVKSSRVAVGGESYDIGANPSAEGGDEGTDDAVETVVDVVNRFEYIEQTLSKAEYKAFMKAYWKKLKEGIEGKIKAAEEAKEDWEVEKWKGVYNTFKAEYAKIKEWVKDEIVKNFDEYMFYIGKSMALGDCLLIPARYLEGDSSPTFYYLNAGLVPEKA
eukprot:GABV01002241.1.p2 GENE.GABV01002241.1~~GABV01002241.1.p2  ORF type:complete len:189 (-),score=95.44 GABV01002241.1:64-630(-)